MENLVERNLKDMVEQRSKKRSSNKKKAEKNLVE